MVQGKGYEQQIQDETHKQLRSSEPEINTELDLQKIIAPLLFFGTDVLKRKRNTKEQTTTTMEYKNLDHVWKILSQIASHMKRNKLYH